MGDQSAAQAAKERQQRRDELIDMFRKMGEQLGFVVAEFCTHHNLSLGVGTISAGDSVVDAKLLGFPDACRYLGIGQTLLQELRRNGEVKVVKIRTKVLFTRKSLDDYVKRLERSCEGPLINDTPNLKRMRATQRRIEKQ